MSNVSTSKFYIAAHSSETVSATVYFVNCIESSADFKLKFMNGEEMPMGRGRLYRSAVQLSGFYLVNGSDNEIVVELVYGVGDYQDNRMFLQGAISVFSGQRAVFTAKSLTTEASKICNYLADRSSIVLQNNNSAAYIWIGGQDLSVTEMNGYKIAPGGMLSLSIKGELYALASEAGKISITEILEV